MMPDLAPAACVPGLEGVPVRDVNVKHHRDDEDHVHRNAHRDAAKVGGAAAAVGEDLEELSARYKWILLVRMELRLEDGRADPVAFAQQRERRS